MTEPTFGLEVDDRLGRRGDVVETQNIEAVAAAPGERNTAV
jgi:hypothetical protein